MTVRLIVQQGPNPHQEFPFVGEQSTIGRSADNQIVVNDAEVSRRHARIISRQDAEGTKYFIEDLGSTNGTFVNGLRCNQPMLLSDGDSVELGDSIQLLFLRGRTEAIEADESEFDTADLPPLSDAEPEAPVYAPQRPAPLPMPDQESMNAEADDELNAPSRLTGRRLAIGCGCGFLLLICLCGATVLFLDSYQQGQLLYCGGLRPLFETILGPVGFSPPCP